MQSNEYDLVVVGAGIFGLTIAQKAAKELNKKVLVIDKRDHIGGNAYSEFCEETGIETHKYGAHLFHTSDQKVWDYVNQFTKFTNYQHRVYTTHRRSSTNISEVFPMPINLGTINQFFQNAYTPTQAKELINKQASQNPAALEGREPKNLSEQGVSLIGQPLFDAFIKNYTAKQWQISADELSPNIIKRLPVRYTYDNRYFNNTYEGLPVDGYESIFINMINSVNNDQSCFGKIDVKLNVDYFKDDAILALKGHIPTVYTGPIDRYFDYQVGQLQWRSLDLVKEVVDTPDFQGCPVMNYADLDDPYTRIHEFKHFHPERHNSANEKYYGYQSDFPKTVIVKEYSKTWQLGDEPYYPVNTAQDKEKYTKYLELAKVEKEKNKVIFGGRLGEYAYYDMDQVFKSALEAFDSKVKHML